MDFKETLSLLESLGKEARRKHYKKHGVEGKIYGVNAGDLKKLAKTIKVDDPLGTQLWNHNIIDARMLAILILPFKEKTVKEMDKMAKEIQYDHVADWFAAYAMKNHPDKETLRKQWLSTTEVMPQRIAWQITSNLVTKKDPNIDVGILLDNLETSMKSAHEKVQWTMNFTLAYIGIHYEEHRQKAINLGENLGLYRDYPVPKGCTSPFAPIWINAMIKQQ